MLLITWEKYTKSLKPPNEAADIDKYRGGLKTI